MKYLSFWLIVLSALLISCSSKHTAKNEEGVLGVFGTKHPEVDRNSIAGVAFVDNYDGDTFTVNIPWAHSLFGEKISVRVRGIDSPEIKGKGPCEKERAQEAKHLVHEKLSQARSIKLVNVARDKYFRILADIEFDGESLSSVLIREKLAVLYDGGTKLKVDWCGK